MYVRKEKGDSKPRFLSQKIEQKDPEKKIPSTAAKATNRSAKEVSLPTRKKK